MLYLTYFYTLASDSLIFLTLSCYVPNLVSFSPVFCHHLPLH